MGATDPWGNPLTFDPERDEGAHRLAEVSDTELVRLFGVGAAVLIPEEKKNSPTLGAWRRQHGVTGWCDEAKVAFATEVVYEAQRRILMERLDGVCQFLAAGATPDQALARIERVVAEWQGTAA
jgi:hypothetical protein